MVEPPQPTKYTFFYKKEYKEKIILVLYRFRNVIVNIYSEKEITKI